jgi:serine/threonine-protein kinase
LGVVAAAAELGLADGSKLAATFRTPQFAGQGLAPLAAGGVVRRDAWEDNYDQAVRGLGLGTPLVAVDGVRRRDHSAGPLGEVELKTNKPNNIFEPGDELVVSVVNKSAKPIHVELVGTSSRGRNVLLTPAAVVVKPGETFKLNPVAVRAGVGKEHVTMLASADPLPPAEVLRGTGVTDRVVHRFYRLTTDAGRARLTADAAAVVKKTIDIETR